MRAAIGFLSLALVTGAQAQSLSDPLLTVNPYLTGLSNPTGIRFTGPNEGFVIEKGGLAGTVRRFTNGGALSTALTLPVANDNFERGLLGIAVDPGFAANGHVYLYHSAGTSAGAWIENRLTRYTWNGSALTSPLAMGTFGTSSDGQAIGGNHNGGVLTFGPDGKLYGVAGDLNRNRVEQNNKATTLSANTGGVFRLNPDGTVPADNPFTGDFARWHAYGVRNSFGLAFDPATGNLWNTENGETTFDEVNRVVRGMNSGWRPIQGPDSRNAANAPGDLNMLPGAVYQDPKFSFASAIGITSIQFLHGSILGPGYDDAVLIGENNNPRLWLLRLNAARDGFVLTANGLGDGVFDAGDALVPFGTGFNVTTDIQIGPDGAVYIVSLGSGEVFRVAAVPEPSAWALALCGLFVIGVALRRRG